MSDIPTNTIPPNVTPAVLTSEDRCETHGLILDRCGNCRRCDDAPRRPRRVQMTRNRPWRAEHPDAVVVDRRSRWGNPFRLRNEGRGLVRYGPRHLERFGREWDYEGRCSAAGTSHHMWFAADDVVETYVRWATPAEVVELFRLTITNPTPGMRAAYPSADGRFVSFTADDVRAELAGRDLACWCRLDQPCHADVLLELANGATPC